MAKGSTKLDTQGQAISAESHGKRYGRSAADILQRSESDVFSDPLKDLIKWNIRSQITNLGNGMG